MRVAVCITYEAEMPADSWIYDVQAEIREHGIPAGASLEVVYPKGGKEGLYYKPTDRIVSS